MEGSYGCIVDEPHCLFCKPNVFIWRFKSIKGRFKLLFRYLTLSFVRYNAALTKAVESGDSDLLLLSVLLSLQEDAKLDATALGLLLRQHPTALAFYREHLERRSNLPQSSLYHSSRAASQTLSVLQNEDDPTLSIKKQVLTAYASKVGYFCCRMK